MASSAAAISCVVVTVVLVSSVPGTVAQPTGDESPSSCNTHLAGLFPCLAFISGNDAAPSDLCCSNLGSMVHDHPRCLCDALSNSGGGGGGGAIPVPLNMTRATQLPLLCRLDIPQATAAACPALVPVGAAAPPPPPVSIPRSRPNASSTAPSTRTPATPTPLPLTPPRPAMTASPAYSSGLKLIVGGAPVALGFMALVSVLAF
uniref:Bifunctional inhibitor/plant lipid transfer protein/seed storage helical domain-containing protein n=1 Tax=Leersia perrieri TaxID=77586 RepID=A0A0D9W5U7_9ORYZ